MNWNKTLLSCSLILISTLFFGQANLTWKGGFSDDWGTSKNWSPEQVPGEKDSVSILSTAQRSLKLDGNRSIAGFNLNNQSIDLAGKTLQVSSKTVLVSGTIFNGKLDLTGQLALIGSSSALSINAEVYVSCSTVTVRNTIFFEKLTVNKTGKTNDNSYGGNEYRAISTFSNYGKGSLSVANNVADKFLADAFFYASDSGSVQVSQHAVNTSFGGNIFVSSTGAGGVKFCQGNGKASLASGKTINVGLSGFSTGTLAIKQFTQLGAEPHVLSLTGTATLHLQVNNTWKGVFEAQAATIKVDSNIFQAAAVFEKYGASNDVWAGGNKFQTAVTLLNSGSGYLMLGNTYPDVFDGTLHVVSNGSGLIYLAHTAQNTRFNGNVTFDCVGGAGVRLGQNGGTAFLADGKLIGTTQFKSGALYLKNFTQLGSQTQGFTLSDTAALYLQSGTTWNASVNLSAPGFRLDGAKFSAVATLTKTGRKSDVSQGGNLFLGNVFLNCLDSGSWSFGGQLPDVFKKELEVFSAKSGVINLAYTATGSVVEGNLLVSSTGGGIQIGQNKGTLTLNLVLKNAQRPFSGGKLAVKNLHQKGTSIQELVCTDSAVVVLQPYNRWENNLKITSPGISADSNTFEKEVVFVKTGKSNDLSKGGNLFVGTLQLTNLGTGSFTFGNNNPDVFHKAVITSASSGLIYLSNGSVDNVFLDTLTLNSTGAGIRFGQGKGSSVLRDKGVFVTSIFRSGILIIKNISQENTPATQLNLSDSASLHFQVGNHWQGSITATAPAIRCDSNVFEQSAFFSKTGINTDVWMGANLFLNGLTIENSGTGNLVLANLYADKYYGATTFVSKAKGQLLVANSAANNEFNGDVFLGSTGGGIRFGQSGGTALLGANKTVNIHSFGFSSGGLYFKNFVQLDTTEQQLLCTDSATVVVQKGTVWNGVFRLTAPSIRLEGLVCNAQAFFTKTGKSNDVMTGGNRFEQQVEFSIDSGAGYLSLANTDTTDYYNGNIVLNNQGAGVKFGQSTGKAILAAGKQLEVGNKGFNSGGLYLKNFEQLGDTPQNLVFSDSALLQIQQGTIFNGDLVADVPSVKIENAIFNGRLAIRKTGITNDLWGGGNQFSKPVTVENVAVGNLTTAFTRGDVFMDTVSFIQSSTGAIQAAYRDTTYFFSECLVSGNKDFATGGGDGWVALVGKQNQRLSHLDDKKVTIKNLLVDKPSGNVYLTDTLTLSGKLGLRQGELVSDSARLLIMNPNTTVYGGSESSYVNGEMLKVGNQSFIFPLGAHGVYYPVAISTPGSPADKVKAGFYAGSPFEELVKKKRSQEVDKLPDCGYWKMERIYGNTPLNYTLCWDSVNDCKIAYYEDLVMLKKGVEQWENLGGILHQGERSRGTFSNEHSAVNPKVLILGSVLGTHPYAFQLFNFDAVEIDSLRAKVRWTTTVMPGNSYFEIEKSTDGTYFDWLSTVNDTTSVLKTTAHEIIDPNPVIGTNYYRLRQYNLDGLYTVSGVIALTLGEEPKLTVFPNPITKGTLTLAFSEPQFGGVELELIDLNAKRMLLQIATLSNEKNHATLNLTNLVPAGTYVLRVISTSKVFVQKVIVP